MGTEGAEETELRVRDTHLFPHTLHNPNPEHTPQHPFAHPHKRALTQPHNHKPAAGWGVAAPAHSAPGLPAAP